MPRAYERPILREKFPMSGGRRRLTRSYFSQPIVKELQAL